MAKPFYPSSTVLKEADYDDDKDDVNDTKEPKDEETEKKILVKGSQLLKRLIPMEVYLKEVKAKLDYVSFHEFIRNIKLLTSSKEQGNIDRKSIVERVRILLLETDDELFEKFKQIIGYNE